MPTITIEVPDTIIVQLGRNAIYGHLDVDVGALPSVSCAYIWAYGLKQVINDAIATKVDKDGRDLTPKDIAAKGVAKLNALYDGTIRVRGESVAKDEYMAEAVRMAKRHIMKSLTAGGFMKGVPKGTEDRMMFAINRRMVQLHKPEVSEQEYLDLFFSTPVGKVIVGQARAAVDARRTLSNGLDDLFPADGVASIAAD
jgi:hypothetical protein